MTAKYSYASSVKSDVSDELINTYLIRPLAGIIVRILFHTPTTPNQVTIASTIAGMAAAYFYVSGIVFQTFAAGLLITAKDILDSADGQLARAKQQFSRKGRFLDSIGDLLVDVLVFAAITHALFVSNGTWYVIGLGVLGFFSTTLRVSYHVFYQASFLHQQDQYRTNRITEEVRKEDLDSDTLTIGLQETFQFLYGWQDRLMLRIDAWCRTGSGSSRMNDSLWYGDQLGLRLSGFMGLGTELFLLMLFSIADKLGAYLLLNVVVLNGVWIGTIGYRKWVLAKKLTRLDSGV